VADTAPPVPPAAPTPAASTSAASTSAASTSAGPSTVDGSTVPAPPVSRLRRVLGDRRLRRALAVAAAFGVWQVLALRSTSPLLPGVDTTVERLADDISSGLIWRHAQVTLLRGGIGFGLAIVVGIGLGVLMARSRLVEAAIEPLLASTYPVPKLALYPIFLLWLGLGAQSKVALVALECLYPIAYNTYAGARAVNKTQMWAAMNAGASRARIVWSVVLKSSLPSILAGIRIALPIAMVVMVVTELIGESLGLGFLVRQAGTRFQPEGALAIVLLLGVFGFVLDRLVVAATRVLAFWERETEL
jgi:ABC-type nitrate/sulfonate/bicarbonate transport system permease component